MGLPDDIHQLSVMMSRVAKEYLKQSSAGGGGEVNLFSGEVGIFLTSVLKRKTLDITLSQQANVSESSELIPCPTGKRILVLNGRVSSAEKVWVYFFNGDPATTEPLPEGEELLLDKASLPSSNFVLPPTVVVLPHYRTSPGRSLWIKTTTKSASDDEDRFIGGYINYIYTDE